MSAFAGLSFILLLATVQAVPGHQQTKDHITKNALNVLALAEKAASESEKDGVDVQLRKEIVLCRIRAGDTEGAIALASASGVEARNALLLEIVKAQAAIAPDAAVSTLGMISDPAVLDDALAWVAMQQTRQGQADRAVQTIGRIRNDEDRLSGFCLVAIELFRSQRFAEGDRLLEETPLIGESFRTWQDRRRKEIQAGGISQGSDDVCSLSSLKLILRREAASPEATSGALPEYGFDYWRNASNVTFIAGLKAAGPDPEGSKRILSSILDALKKAPRSADRDEILMAYLLGAFASGDSKGASMLAALAPREIREVLSVNLASTCAAQGRAAEARKTIEAIKQPPIRLLALAAVAEVLAQQKHPEALSFIEEAEAFLPRVKEEEPKVPALAGLAEAYAGLGDTEKARSTLRRLEALPRFEELIESVDPSRLVGTYLKAGDVEGAERVAQKVPETIVLLIPAFVGRGDLEASARCVAKARARADELSTEAVKELCRAEAGALQPGQVLAWAQELKELQVRAYALVGIAQGMLDRTQGKDRTATRFLNLAIR